MRWFLPGLSLRSPRFGRRPVHEEFVVHEVALGQVFVKELRSFSVNSISPVLLTHLFFYHRRYIILAITLKNTCVSLQRHRTKAQVVFPCEYPEDKQAKLRNL
jgi:hypothetical protein